MTARVEVWMEGGWGGRGELGASEVNYASLEPLGSSGSVVLFSPHPALRLKMRARGTATVPLDCPCSSGSPLAPEDLP